MTLVYWVGTKRIKQLYEFVKFQNFFLRVCVCVCVSVRKREREREREKGERERKEIYIRGK